MKRYLPIIITFGVIFIVLVLLTYWEPGKKDVLDASIWRVEKLNSTPMLVFSTLTLRFHNRKISGSSECNRFQGRYEITGDEIAIKVLERTTDECMQPGIIEQDDAFIDNLENAVRYSFSENDLKLYSKEGQELLDLLSMAK